MGAIPEPAKLIPPYPPTFHFLPVIRPLSQLTTGAISATLSGGRPNGGGIDPVSLLALLPLGACIGSRAPSRIGPDSSSSDFISLRSEDSASRDSSTCALRVVREVAIRGGGGWVYARQIEVMVRVDDAYAGEDVGVRRG